MRGVRLVAVWIAALVPLSCGDVDVGQQGLPALKLNSLQPRPGEQGVSPDVVVMAVFSDEVKVGDRSEQINPKTFYLSRNGIVFQLIPSVGAYPFVVLLKPPTLTPGGTYLINVKDTIAGAESDPLGVDIVTSFTVAP